MLKKLVIVGSLLAVGPLLAGCPGAGFMPVQTISDQTTSRLQLKNKTAQQICTQMASGLNLWDFQQRLAGELATRGKLKDCRNGVLTPNKGTEGTRKANNSSDHLANKSKNVLCQIAEYGRFHNGRLYKEEAKQILRSRGLSCNRYIRLAEAQRARDAQKSKDAERARQAAIEQKKRDDAQRQAKAKREAEERRQAEAKRKADAAKKSKLYRVGSGSGFSISRDGLIVTNHHVIDGCSAVAVSDKGEMYRAIVQSVDERNDLALLKSKLRPTHVFALNPDGTDILREIYVAGYPFGRMVSNSVKVTKGIVSSLVGLKNNSAQIQIDAPIQVGNSGGPILDSEGRVVGVSVSKLDAFEVMKKKKQIPEGVGFGVKSETLIQVLKSSGARTYKRGGLKTTDDIAKAIRGGTFYISCLMTAERYKRLKGKKAMFEGVNLD